MRLNLRHDGKRYRIGTVPTQIQADRIMEINVCGIETGVPQQAGYPLLGPQ